MIYEEYIKKFPQKKTSTYYIQLIYSKALVVVAKISKKK